MHESCRKPKSRMAARHSAVTADAAPKPDSADRRRLDQETARSGSPKRRRARWAGAALALLGAASPGPSGQTATAQGYDRPAQLVRLPSGRTMNMVCAGRGSPTVLLESGFGAAASAWSLVQPQLARSTRVCSYDRAGYGFSEPGPMPRDGAAIARDLDQALRAAGVRGPFIVVGHSAGGLYGRLFAARRPRDIVGLVLVDTTVTPPNRHAAEAALQRGALQGVRERPAKCLQAALARSRPALKDGGCFSEDDPRSEPLAVRADTWRSQLSELDTLFLETADELRRAAPVWQKIPAVLLTASPTGRPAGAEDPAAASWQAAHRQEAATFLRADVQLVKSSHLIMIDRPDVVVAAVSGFLKGSGGGAASR